MIIAAVIVIITAVAIIIINMVIYIATIVFVNDNIIIAIKAEINGNYAFIPNVIMIITVLSGISINRYII